MKRSLIFGGALSFAAISSLFSSCSSDKDELGSVSEDMSFVHLSAVVDDVPEALRASWQISNLNTLNPNWAEAEKFLWESGDYMVSLCRGTNKVDVQYKLPITTENDALSNVASLDVKLPSNGTAWFFYPSATIANVDTTTANTKVENACVTLNIAQTQNQENQHKYAFLRTDEVVLKDGKVQNDQVNFNHLTTLLRFHLRNSSNRKYSVKSIKIESSKEVFLTNAIYNIASLEFKVQEDINNSSYVNHLIWENLGYKTDTLGTKSDVATNNKSIYDALLVVFPISGEQLNGVTLKIYATLYDTESGAEFTPNPLVLDPTRNANVATQFAKGFPRGVRTYFNMNISANNTVSVSVGDYPGGWEASSEKKYDETPVNTSTNNSAPEVLSNAVAE